MNLDLTENERDLLLLVLESFVSELRGEITSGVKHNMKAKLKNEETLLKTILLKLTVLK